LFCYLLLLIVPFHYRLEVLRNQLPIQIIASPRFLESSRHHSQNKSSPSSSCTSSSSLLSSLQPFQWEFLQTLVSVFPSGLFQETVQEIQELVQISTEQISELIAARSSSSSSSTTSTSSTSNTTTENSPWIYLDGAYYQVNIKIQRWTPLEILSQSSHPEVIHLIELLVCLFTLFLLFFPRFLDSCFVCEE
jgi:hypothetical protein